MSETVKDIVNIVASLVGGGVIGGLVSWKRSKSQNDLDLSEAWGKFVDPLMKRLTELEKKVMLLEKDRNDWRDWARRLVDQVKSLGEEPVPMFPDEEEV